jgi:hypothetical protein
MRRWLVFFLMAMLPLQFSWAAVAAYCTHERQPAHASHFGHHEHRHDHAGAPAASDEPASPDGAFAVDHDCAFCQIGHAQTLPSEPVRIAGAAQSPRVGGEPALHESHIADAPERPDRHAA